MKTLTRTILATILLVGGSLAAGAQESSRWSTASLPAVAACANGAIKLPGSAACLRLGGRLRAEMTVSNGFLKPSGHGGASGGTLAQGRAVGYVTLDARTQTELGPVRAYVSVRGGSAQPPSALAR